MKKSNNIIVIGFILCIIFFISALAIRIPNHFISFYYDQSAVEYVGGDAYNYIIEAALRGGEIAGKMISKTICFSMSAGFLYVSLKRLFENKETIEEKIDESKNDIQNNNLKNVIADEENKSLASSNCE